ncbi:MAG: replication endonuclease [Pseudomonadota bacterium]
MHVAPRFPANPMSSSILGGLASLGGFEDRRWRDRQLSKLTGPTQRVVIRAAESAAAAADSANIKNRSANIAVREGVSELLVLPGLPAGASECRISKSATAMSDRFLKSYAKLSAAGHEPAVILARLLDAVARVCVPWISTGPMQKLLKKDDPSEREIESQIARLTCPRWWRRQLRRACARRLEHFLRRHGEVSRRAGAYVSGYALRRHEWRKAETWALLSAMVAISDMGDEVPLSDVAAAGQANPRNRATELILRMRGYDEVAEKMGLQGAFFTLTAPSRFHARLSRSGEQNPKYDGSSPVDAQAWLNTTWERIRIAWHDEGIRAFGFRVAEPHHDGTPHWHLLLHFRPDQSERAWQIFEEKALRESPDERGANKRRATRVVIDPAKGTGAGYIAKYVAKNVLGEGLGPEGDIEAGVDGSEGARRVAAWASLWGIRQFQQIGSVSVTVYRELRRVRESLEDMDIPELEALRAAADRGEWGEFVELMGGPFVARQDAPVRAWMVARESPGVYGDVIERLQGIVMRTIGITARVITRTKNWRIERAAPVAATGPPRSGGALDLCQ